MIIVLKIAAIILGLMSISKTWYDFKKREENFVMSTFWTIVWSSIIFIALFPLLIDKVSRAISGENSSYGALLGIAFISLLYITYRIYLKANRTEQKIKEIVVKIGLKDIE